MILSITIVTLHMSAWQKRGLIMSVNRFPWSSAATGVSETLEYSIDGSADGGAEKPGGTMHPRGAIPSQPPSGA